MFLKDGNKLLRKSPRFCFHSISDSQHEFRINRNTFTFRFVKFIFNRFAFIINLIISRVIIEEEHEISLEYSKGTGIRHQRRIFIN